MKQRLEVGQMGDCHPFTPLDHLKRPHRPEYDDHMWELVAITGDTVRIYCSALGEVEVPADSFFPLSEEATDA
jgi:hypothetical protein